MSVTLTVKTFYTADKRYSVEQLREVLASSVSMWVWIPPRTVTPDLALVVFFLGITGIYVEFCSPGRAVAGTVGSVMAVLGLATLAAFPIDWRGAALIALAFVLYVLEALYVTRGALTLGGAAVLTLGSVLLIGRPEPRIYWGTALAVAVPFSAISGFLFSVAARAWRNKHRRPRR